MKKEICLLTLILCLLIVFKSQAGVKEYRCGENCTATLDEESGVVRVSGTGAMDRYNSETRYQTPWYGDKAKITSVVIEEGITEVGNFSFYNCSKIKNIELAKSVQNVRFGAFDEVGGIQNVTMYDSTLWENQDDFNDAVASPNIQVNCIGNMRKCKTNFLHTPKLKSATFRYKGKRIYTIEEALMAFDELRSNTARVGLKYR